MKFLANAAFSATLLSCLVLLPLPVAAGVILDANFENTELDAPIGTGGAIMGEPVSVGSPLISAIVRGNPMPTRSLEISDTDDYAAGSVRFDFLGDREVSTGQVTMEANLWFLSTGAGHGFSVSVREYGGASRSFTTLRFNNGSISVNDAAGNAGIVGNYEGGQMYHLSIVFDMDARIYDVLFGGAPVLQDRAHGVLDRGVGGFYFGCNHDADLDGTFFVDDIVVSATSVVPAATDSWGSVKSEYR